MKNLFLFFLSVILSLLVCEILLRNVFVNDQLKFRIEANKKQFKNFQKLTWKSNNLSFEPSSEGVVNHPEYKYKILHDEIGFRNPCYSSKKKNIKNIVVGDSFVYGVGVEDLDTLNCQIEIDNYTLGVPNASSSCYVQLIQRHYPNLKKNFNIEGLINIHIILYIGNDFEKLLDLNTGCPTEEINEIKFNRRGYLAQLNHLLTKGFLSEFYLPQLPKLLYKNYTNERKYRNINLLDRKYFIDNGNDTFYTSYEHIDDVKFENSLKEIFEKLKNVDKSNFNISFYLMPSGSDISKKRLIRKSKISGFNYENIDTDIKYSSLINSCKKIKINCKDLRKYFTDKSYYYHDTHLNREGVKILSKIIDKNSEKIRN